MCTYKRQQQASFLPSSRSEQIKSPFSPAEMNISSVAAQCSASLTLALAVFSNPKEPHWTFKVGKRDTWSTVDTPNVSASLGSGPANSAENVQLVWR